MARRKAVIQNMAIQAGLYIRVSSREQAEEGYSLVAQENTLRQYCMMMGWEVIDIFKYSSVLKLNCTTLTIFPIYYF